MTLLAVLEVLLFCCDNLWALPTTAFQAEKVVQGWLNADMQPLGTALAHTFTDSLGLKKMKM